MKFTLTNDKQKHRMIEIVTGSNGGTVVEHQFGIAHSVRVVSRDTVNRIIRSHESNGWNVRLK